MMNQKQSNEQMKSKEKKRKCKNFPVKKKELKNLSIRKPNETKPRK